MPGNISLNITDVNAIITNKKMKIFLFPSRDVSFIDCHWLRFTCCLFDIFLNKVNKSMSLKRHFKYKMAFKSTRYLYLKKNNFSIKFKTQESQTYYFS